MRNGVIQDWGLVEFFDSEEAEKTQEELNGYNLKGHKIVNSILFQPTMLEWP